jgi:hypothetical protein
MAQRNLSQFLAFAQSKDVARPSTRTDSESDSDNKMPSKKRIRTFSSK